MGKKIVNCYYGSDLRSRGIIKEMDDLADLSLTTEYDHLSMKNNIHYIFIHIILLNYQAFLQKKIFQQYASYIPLPIESIKEQT